MSSNTTEYNRDYYKKNVDKINKRQREYRKNNPDKVRIRDAEYQCKYYFNKRKGSPKYKDRQRKMAANRCKNLTDGFIVNYLKAQFKITTELIDMKREQIIKFRLLKEIKNGLNK